MTKSSLRKDQRKTVTTNLAIGWNDAITLNSGVSESGITIYVVPRKGESMFQRMLWTYQLQQDPTDLEVVYVVLDHRPFEAMEISIPALTQIAILVAKQRWQSVTAAGFANTSTTIEVDMKQLVMTRESNLQRDFDFSIVPAYRASANAVVGQGGVLWVKETLFQDNFRDDLDEWSGYTFEESAS